MENDNEDNNLQQIELNSSSRTDQEPRESRETSISRSASIINMILFILSIGIALYVSFFCFNGFVVLFSWHPSLMVFGYLCFMGQAIVSLSDAGFFTSKSTHQNKVTVHWMLQLITGTLISIAFAAIYINKERNSKPHFQSIHGILGLTTFCLTLSASFGGLFTKYSHKFKRFIKPIFSKIIHSSLGILNYLLASVTIILGIFSTWFQQTTSQTTQFVLTFLIVLMIPMVLTKAIKLLKHRSSIILNNNHS